MGRERKGRGGAGADEIATPAAAFQAALAERGLKNTRQRRAVAAAFFESDAHLSLEEIHRRARVIDPGVGFSTVYRTMKILAEAKLAEERKFADGITRYERAYERPAHEHLICVECGAVEEFGAGEIAEIQRLAARRAGFEPLWHTLEVYGRCRECRR